MYYIGIRISKKRKICNYSLFLMNNNDEEYIDIVTNYTIKFFLYKFRNMEKLEIKHIISSLIQNFQKSKLSTDSKHGDMD